MQNPLGGPSGPMGFCISLHNQSLVANDVHDGNEKAGMRFGAIIIGDEIMSGKRQDKHMAQVITTLGERGLDLAWCQYLADDPGLITATLARTLASDDAVFSFGGIGATPDDHTRQCAANAAGVTLMLHPDAEIEIRARFGADITPQRLL